jgi:nucleoside-diphosphate-sugar epimerase
MVEGASVAVTGAGGFLGANLVRRLLELRCDVHAIVRPGSSPWRLEEIRSEFTVHHADVRDVGALETAFRRTRHPVVFHLASVRGNPVEPERIREMLQTSVEGTYNVLTAASAVGVQRIVHLGSALEYGVSDRPLTEADPLEPTTIRGAAKAAATVVALTMARWNEPKAVVLRPFTVYGPWESPSNLIPTALDAALRGREIDLTPPGCGRDLLFVDDVVDALLLAADTEAGRGEAINIGYGRGWTNEEVVEIVEAVAGSPVRVGSRTFPPRPTDTTHRIADIAKARRLLGWEPRHDLHAGVEKTLDWLRPRLGVYER